MAGAFFSTRAEIRIACVGNSITAGSGLDTPSTERYPAVLEGLLGSKYKVGVFARGGMCLQRHAEISVWYSNHIRNARNFDPDIVVLLLGTNDSKYYNWKSCSTFTADYADLLDTLPLSESNPVVLPVLPPAAFSALGYIDRFTIRDSIVPAIRKLAEERSLLYVDIHTPFSQHPEYYTDGIHPNADGARVLADLVYDALLQLSPSRDNNLSVHSLSTPHTPIQSRLQILPERYSRYPVNPLYFDLRGRTVKETGGVVPVIEIRP